MAQFSEGLLLSGQRPVPIQPLRIEKSSLTIFAKLIEKVCERSGAWLKHSRATSPPGPCGHYINDLPSPRKWSHSTTHSLSGAFPPLKSATKKKWQHLVQGTILDAKMESHYRLSVTSGGDFAMKTILSRAHNFLSSIRRSNSYHIWESRTAPNRMQHPSPMLR